MQYNNLNKMKKKRALGLTLDIQKAQEVTENEIAITLVPTP
jgi:hypothetical protein